MANGVQNIQFDHLCLGPGNSWYQVRTYKQSLLQHNDGAYEIVGVSRPIAVEETQADVSGPLEESLAIYQQFDSRDKRICMLLAEGRSSNEIGQILDISGKTIDNRRRSIIECLGFEQSIEVVKMMVRFEERGYDF